MNKRIFAGLALLLLGSLSWAGPPGQGARTAGTDSLPWGGGRVVFGPWVRVDDAPGPSIHPGDHPQMVIDSRGRPNMYTVWQDDRANTTTHEIFFAKSTNLGASWTKPNLNLSQSPGIDDIYPWIAVDSRDTLRVRLYVVWQSWRNSTWKVYFTRSTDGGATFAPADTARGILVVNSFSSGINFGPQPKIALDAKSDTGQTYLYLTWADYATGEIHVNLARSMSGSRTDTLGNLFTNLGIRDRNPSNVNRNPYVAVDDSGIVYWAWARGTGGSNNDPHPWIGFNLSTDRGATFRTQDSIVNDDRTQAYRGHPTITLNNSNGNILLAWEDARGTSDPTPNIWWSRSTNRGVSFSPNLKANRFADSTASWENRKPSIWMDPKGVAVVAWNDNYGNAQHFGIHLAAYNDSTVSFGPAQSLFNTFTQTSGGNFGGNLYPPSLKVVVIDTVDNFFLVWQDLLEDTTGGNIYSVRGWVVKEFADLDIYNDALDVHGNLMDFGKVAAGPPRQVRSFQLVNTDASHNPDPDGPSLDTLLVNVRPVSMTLTSPNNPPFDAQVSVPTTLRQGQVQTGTVTLRVPDNQPPGVYQGPIVIQGAGRDTFDVASDTFNLRVEVGNPLNLGQFKILPNPFKPKEGHTKIYFYGLPANCKVRIYDLSGVSVKELQNTQNNGTVAWDPMHDPNVASGIYFYYVTYGQKDIQKGKLSVIK